MLILYRYTEIKSSVFEKIVELLRLRQQAIPAEGVGIVIFLRIVQAIGTPEVGNAAVRGDTRAAKEYHALR